MSWIRRDRSSYEVERTDQQWRNDLGPERFRILRRGGTEPPGSGDLTYSDGDGVYRCGACSAPLFDSTDKFDSGTGWPSFTAPVSSSAVQLVRDYRLLLPRTEVRCRRCGSHLGHVFRDGPGPTRERYCMNSSPSR